jgi:dihydropteroate synthase
VEKIALRDKDVPVTPPHSSNPKVLKILGRSIRLEPAPLIMGIININDDSFSDDGNLDPVWALERARILAGEGAHIIDVGAESARTNRPPISVEEEIRRLLPVVEGFALHFNHLPSPPLLSVNTWRPEVVEAILPLGVDLLNDMGGLPDDRNARLCALHGTALLIMHTTAAPKIPQTDVIHRDIMGTLLQFFDEKISLATAAGLPRESLVLDPGIDFAKKTGDNLVIYRELGRLRNLDLPILLPISRKSVIGRILGISKPAERDSGTAACIVVSTLRRAAILRVHNVAMARMVIAATKAVMPLDKSDFH